MSGKLPANAMSPLGKVKKASSFLKAPQQQNSSLTVSQNGQFANLHTMPVPHLREIAKSTYISFCDCQRRNKTNSQHISKIAFIKNVLALLQSVYKHAAILAYNSKAKLNSLCHPNHVPTNDEEFIKYFPRVYITRTQI